MSVRFSSASDCLIDHTVCSLHVNQSSVLLPLESLQFPQHRISQNLRKLLLTPFKQSQTCQFGAFWPEQDDVVMIFLNLSQTCFYYSYYLYGLGGRMLVSVLSKIFFSLLRPPTVLAFAFLLTFSRLITCSTSTARSGIE